MKFLEILKQRYTCKYYNQERKISLKDLNTIVKAIQLSPSSVNLQPWEFYFVSGTKKEQLRSCVEGFNLQRYDASSHVLFICAKTKFSEKHLDNLIILHKKNLMVVLKVII